MSGTKAGGLKAKETNLKLHGKDFYSRIGHKGGVNGCGPDYKGGFASDIKGQDGLTGKERAMLVGAIGGLKSRRGPSIKLNLEEEINKVRSNYI